MKKHGLLIVITFTLFAGIYAYFNFLLPLDVFLWDESHHGFYAMQIFNDLQTLDWGSFWTHTNNQALWMPLHAWVAGLFLYLLGFSYASARLSSLFLYFICSIIIYLIGCELSKEKGRIIGFIAAILYLASPMMLHLGTVNMQEMLGVFICLMTVYFIIRFISIEAPWKYLAIGFLLSVSYWSKINYAAVMLLGVGLYQLSLLWDIRNNWTAPIYKSERTVPSRQKSKKQKPIKRKYGIFNEFIAKYRSYYKSNSIIAWLIDNTYIIIGFLPLFILWWATPPFERKFALAVTFRQGSVSSSTSIVASFIGTLMFYIQSLITSYNLSFWIALGCLLSIIGSLLFFNDKKIRLISIVFYANLVFVSVISFAQERLFSTAAPLCFILLGFLSLFVFERLKTSGKIAILLYTIISIVTLSFIYDLTQLTGYTKEVANRSIQSFIYKDSLNRFSPPFLFGLLKRPSFTYPIDPVYKSKNFGSFKSSPKSGLQDVLEYYSSNIDKNKSISTMISLAELSPYVIYWHFHNWLAPVLSVNDLGINNKYFWASDYFLDLDVSKESPYDAEVLDRRWANIEKELLKGGYIKLITSKDYSDLGLTAKIYKREKAINFQ